MSTTIQKNTTTFHCPHCFQLVSVKDFESHCLSIHELNTSQLCAWCFGHEKRSTPHLLKCHVSFLSSLETYPSQNVQSSFPMWLPLENDIINEDISDHFPCGPVWEVNLDLSGITYTCQRLNLAVACFQWFFKVQKETNWYHIIVDGSHYQSFLKAMDDEGSKTRTLPFSCLCKVQGRSVFHRHFVLVTLKGPVQKTFWKTINSRTQVKTPIDLVYLIGSLSRGKPACVGQTFFTITPLPPLYSMVLAVQWNGGLMEVLRETYKTVDPILLLPVARSVNGLWAILVRDLPGITTQIVLPVTRNFYPTLYPTDYFVYLMDGRKLFFEQRETLATIPEQVENGNIFYDTIGDELYYPTPYQQKYIKILQPLTKRITDLECMKEETERQLNTLENRLESVKKQNKLWDLKLKKSQNKIDCLQSKLILRLEKEIDLRMENVKIKKQNNFYRRIT